MTLYNIEKSHLLIPQLSSSKKEILGDGKKFYQRSNVE